MGRGKWGTDDFTALTPGVWPPSKAWASPGLGTDGRGVGTSPECHMMCHSHQARVIPAGWQRHRELNGAAGRGCTVPGGRPGISAQRGTGPCRAGVGPASLRAGSSPGAICWATAVSDSGRARAGGTPATGRAPLSRASPGTCTGGTGTADGPGKTPLAGHCQPIVGVWAQPPLSPCPCHGTATLALLVCGTQPLPTPLKPGRS